ncbi:MAG: hypothetical protein JO222_12595, partial [Frankiales bacterium]|nr:hypothetical protein [Frankiales bacterium]
MNARVTASGPVRRADVEGWFPADDRVLFTELLGWQSRTQPSGNLVELGAYLGKSAIVIGDHVRDGETFTVCDLFGMDPDASDVRSEVTEQYGGLTRERFEQN